MLCVRTMRNQVVDIPESTVASFSTFNDMELLIITRDGSNYVYDACNKYFLLEEVRKVLPNVRHTVVNGIYYIHA